MYTFSRYYFLYFLKEAYCYTNICECCHCTGADPGGLGGARAPWGERPPSKVGPVTPQTLCSIGRYFGCAPPPPPTTPYSGCAPLDHPFWIRRCCIYQSSQPFYISMHGIE